MAEPEDQLVPANESVTRFVYDSDKVKGRVLPGVFLPMYEAETQRWETSVCRLDNCSDERVWHIARTQVTHKPVKARVDIPVEAVRTQQLSCVIAPVEGFQEHAVIVGWPSEKEDRKRLAMALTKSCTARFPPPVDDRPS